MADFISQIQNIANVYAPSTVSTPKEAGEIATLIKSGTIDTVNFSDDAQNLFQISQIDSRFDDFLGVPSSLNDEQQRELDKLGAIAQNLFSSGSLQRSSIDYDGILENITKLYEGKELSTAEQDKLVTLGSELQSYVQNLSITQLFSTSSVSATNTLFNEQLSDSEKGDLGKMAQQLNRVLFTSTDDEGSSFLDSLNSLYGLNRPSSEEQDDIFSLFSQRNSLLSSVLLNRNLSANYGDLL